MSGNLKIFLLIELTAKPRGNADSFNCTKLYDSDIRNRATGRKEPLFRRIKCHSKENKM